MLLIKKEDIEHAKFRALAQIQISKKEGVEAFEEYMKVAFPYLAAEKEKRHSAAIKVLEAEVKRGAFSIRPQQSLVVKSRMKGRIMSRTKPQSPAQADDLYRKLGNSIVSTVTGDKK